MYMSKKIKEILLSQEQVFMEKRRIYYYLNHYTQAKIDIYICLHQSSKMLLPSTYLIIRKVKIINNPSDKHGQ